MHGPIIILPTYLAISQNPKRLPIVMEVDPGRGQVAPYVPTTSKPSQVVYHVKVLTTV